MSIWSAEIKELETLYGSIKGRYPELEKELEQLIRTEDANVVMLYSRRCLEVIVTDLCETELNRPRKTEPLKGIIDKLIHEEKIPSHIFTSMDHLNSLSTFGAHPKEFDPRQVKPVLNNLITVIEWYLNLKNVDYLEELTGTETETEVETESESVTVSPYDSIESDYVAKRKRKTLVISSWIIGSCIIVLIAFGISSIFQKLKFRDIRESDGRISVTVLPFQNLTPDTLLNFWQEGVQNLLINSLSNSKELSVREFQTMNNILSNKEYANYASITPSVGRDIASKLETGTFIMGSLMKAGDRIRISAQLRNTKTEEIYKTFEVEGKTEDEFFQITDSLSGLIKDYLEIKALEKNIDEEKRAFGTTQSAEAYRYYLEGNKLAYAYKFELAIQSFTRAIEIDSSFTNAYYILSLLYWSIGHNREATYYLNKAYAGRDKIPLNEKLALDVDKALIEKNIQEALNLEEQIVELMPQSAWWWRAIGSECFALEQYNKSVTAFEKAYQLYQKMGLNLGLVSFYLSFGGSLHQTGNHKREKEIFEEGLKVAPNSWASQSIIYNQAVCAFSQGDTIQGNKYMDKLRSNRITENWPESEIINEQAGIYAESDLINKADAQYRRALLLGPKNPEVINSYAYFLIKNNIDVKKGMELIDRALKSEPENCDFLYTKGLGLYKLGRLGEASVVLKKSWDLRYWYLHEHYLLMQEVEKELSNKGK
jgi:tetratricopeptide (TPR) repeat protein